MLPYVTMVSELSRHRQEWPTVHALSRSKKEEYTQTVVHHHVDLLSSPENMAKDLKTVHASHVFFAAYIQKDTEQENWDVNGEILSNFLQALVKTDAIKTVERIILLTGAKQYGVHLGVPKQPMLESDPKISKELDSKNDGLVFPGSPSFYTKFDSFTSSKLSAQFCIWAALEPRAANEAFNVVNGDAESWQNLWPKVTDYFNTKVKPDQFKNGAGSSILKYVAGDASSTTKLAPKPPITVHASTIGLEGTPALEQCVVEQNIDLEKWSKRQDVKDAWARIARDEGLEEDAFQKATWGFLNSVLGRSYNIIISMSKARKAGWTGYADSWESLEGAFNELRKGKILPRAGPRP
ncbi:hypothetical protein EJ07DRAFT_163640 [Lizonia empirigonia]|nr:hypothetical protein EJ07DRAFT_163640 [Lizonia empirigonia]